MYWYIVWSWLGLCAVAYGMYAVAYVFESRVPGRDVPVVSRQQSKAYMPGYMGLALFIAVAPARWPEDPLVVVLGVMFGVGAVVVVHYLCRDSDDHEAFASNEIRSPSKRYHDFVVCFVFGFTAVSWWFPEFLLNADRHWWLVGIGGAGLVVWAAGGIWDAMHDDVPNDRRYPGAWYPLWKKPPPAPMLW